MNADKPQLNVETYVDSAAEIMGLDLRPEYREGTIANFKRIAAIAELVLEFPLPEEIEIAPIFQP